MLRRRIFSSAMASVMALSSIAVVAQAEETTNKVVTKEQLQELVQVELGDTWRADVLCNYGTVSQTAMLDALEAADVILADADADEEDYTVAYMMVKSIYGDLKQYSAEQLKALIDECKPIIETNNIYNEELQDQIYTPDSFGKLEEELSDAEGFVTSTSLSDITAAYEELLAAKDGLDKYQVVSKSMFRNVLKQYDEILDNQFDYDMWRRGTHAWVDTSNGMYWGINNYASSTYGHFYNYVAACKDQIVAAYDAIDAIKGLTKTTDADIYAGYVMAQDCIAVYNAWSADNVNTATKAGLSTLIKKYHGQLVFDFAADTLADLLAEIEPAANLMYEADTVLTEAQYNALVDTDGDGAASDAEKAAYTDAASGSIVKAGPTSAANMGVAEGAYVTNVALFEGTECEGNTVELVATLDWTDAEWKANVFATTADIYADGAVEYVNGRDTDDDGEIDDVWGLTYDPDSGNLIGANATIKVKNTALKAIYVPVTEDGYWDPDDTRTVCTTKEEKAAQGGKFQTISINSKFDLSKLIDITGLVPVYTPAEDVDKDASENSVLDAHTEGLAGGVHAIAGWDSDAEWDFSVSLTKAMEIAEIYLYGSKEDIKNCTAIKDIDETGIIAKDPSATSKEYQLAYRYLYYALSERYDGSAESGCSHTRADVKKLIADAWELIEATGDTAIFNASNVALVEARELAMDWVSDANSDKLYKDYVGGYAADYDGVTEEENPYTAEDDDRFVGVYPDSTTAYHALEGHYKQLKAEYDALAYSFGEIYEKLAEVAEDIDDGKLDATDDLIAAMDDVAGALSKVSIITKTTNPVEYEDNAAFDVDRIFNENNRLVTWTDKDHPVNIAQIAEEHDVETAPIYCAADFNPTHFALLNAYNAMLAAIAAQAEPEFIPGDANGKDGVTPADAAAILKWCVGLGEIDEKAAEFDGVEGITPADAAAILKYCVQ